MMRKLLIYPILTFTTLLFSCKKDYLTIEPDSSQNGINYFKTKDQFINAVNGAYAPLQGLYNDPFWEIAEMRSDNTSYQFNNEDHSGNLRQEIDEFREISLNDDVLSFFKYNYIGIGRCNVILSRLSKAAITDSEAVDQISGQASFLRAYYYFNLVRIFGEVPLVLEEITSKKMHLSQIEENQFLISILR